MEKRSVLKTKGKFDSRGSFRTWVEINQNAVKKNIAVFRKLIEAKGTPRTNSRKRFGAGVKLWSVVKSNAYGHGLVQFSKLAEKLGTDGFCVDSFIEGVRLRKEGIKKPILVLGPTLAELAKDAASKDITLSISNFEILKHLSQTKTPPKFHIKIDTGMSRQGFFLEDVPKLIKFLNSKFPEHRTSIIDRRLSGIYTHFASAKDLNYPTYTDRQFAKFEQAVKLFEKSGLSGGKSAGGKHLIKHVSATGGAMILWPLAIQRTRTPIRQLAEANKTRTHLKLENYCERSQKHPRG
ncbi:MAG: alanine racemase [Candidatus Liptonbacteria bacterium]|nr:alanine racemase [Candidatus Liptonbacteria bacterium]